MRPQLARADEVVAKIAARQHGVVAVHQLHAAGFSPDVIKARVRRAGLHRLYRGVYAVGHPGLNKEGRWMAAVLAGGSGAVLSHSSAAALWEMIPIPEGPIHVTVPRAGGRARHPRLIVHRSATLLPSHSTVRRAIPVTTPARTLEDLRRLLPRDRFDAAVRQAEFLRLPIGEYVDTDRTRSELEARFLRLCRRHRLPAPEVNVPVGPFVVDFLWRDRRLAVEVDGYRSHGTRSAFEADRARDARLKLLGYDVVRFTYRQITREPGVVAATLRALLDRRRRA